MKRELWYSVVVRDRHGKIVSRERRKSRSLVRQYNQSLYCHLNQSACDILDIGGISRSVSPHATTLHMNAPASNITYGIVFGIGTTAVVIGDYDIETLIAEGAGAGQFNYLICTVSLSSVSAPNCGYVVSRSAVNNSGGLITVRESGIRYLQDGFNFLCVRDVFGTPQDVPNGGSMTVNYTLRVTA